MRSERYSLSYAGKNNNFIIQNLPRTNQKIDENFYSIVCVLLNLLQRGNPTVPSEYLRMSFGDVSDSVMPVLLDTRLPNWINTIKGYEEKNDFPAVKFYEELIPRYLPDDTYIQQLILPEVSFNEITNEYSQIFYDQQVDFYIPQCKLVIEIDGKQHDSELSINKDKERDEYLKKFGVKVYRITASDVKFETDNFKEFMNKLQNEIHSCDQIQKYKEYFCGHTEIKAISINAIARFQCLILTLLRTGIIDLEEWNFAIYENDVKLNAQAAIEDVLIWLNVLCDLAKVPFNKPNYKIKYVKFKEELMIQTNSIKVDFSMLKRWTDENQYCKEILYVRTDYFEDRNYFTMATSEPITYHLIKEGKESDIKNLEFLLRNIFLYDSFNDGQLPIIMNVLEGKETVGLLPTGSGKSLCYQLAALLQPCISFVVCPIKSLMYDQKLELESIGVNQINLICSDQNAIEKKLIHKDFSNGKYHFIFISPERFQSQEFRNELKRINNSGSFGLAVIDEVHCLSEWGHDFRTSYLTLVPTIRKYCPSARLLGLTATASKFVLKDIMKEFEIENDNVKTVLSYTRPELEFRVKKIETNPQIKKKSYLFEYLKSLNSRAGIFNLDDENSKCGIIFTQLVNTEDGCYELHKEISKLFNIETGFFSGSIPKTFRGKTDDFNNYKRTIQQKFKNNEVPLLVTTKAFGMGVNKKNIRYTVHYGIPNSLEALYQEAGRAGRDKNNAVNYVLYEEDTVEPTILEKFFDINSTVEDIKQLFEGIKRKDKKDILTIFYLWFENNPGVEVEYENMKKIFSIISREKGSDICLTCQSLDLKLSEVERSLYRLSILGIIEDWTIEDYNKYSSKVNISLGIYDNQSVVRNLQIYIKKYDPTFKMPPKKEIQNDSSRLNEIIIDKSLTQIEKYMKFLLVWIYDNIVYQRRQAMKTIVEQCNSFTDSDSFKYKMEEYFKFTEDTYILDEIAINPYNYKLWNSVLFNDEESIDINHLQYIKIKIGRFLESYRFNTGLNFISGVVRLILGEYTDSDGKSRLESAFHDIAKLTDADKAEILKITFNIFKFQSDDVRNEISKLLCNYFEPLVIHESLEDNYSLSLVIETLNEKLREVNGRIICLTQKS